MNNKCESKFREWLEKNNMPYIYFDQSIETYSTVFRNFTQRPDFMILIPHFGFILVDVEDKQQLKKHKKYCFNADEIKRYSNLQRSFNLQVWYAVSNEDLNYDTWFWISVSQILEAEVEPYKNTLDKTNTYFAFEPNKLIQIASNDTMSRLFEKIFQL